MSRFDDIKTISIAILMVVSIGLSIGHQNEGQIIFFKHDDCTFNSTIEVTITCAQEKYTSDSEKSCKMTMENNTNSKPKSNEVPTPICRELHLFRNVEIKAETRISFDCNIGDGNGSSQGNCNQTVVHGESTNHTTSGFFLKTNCSTKASYTIKLTKYEKNMTGEKSMRIEIRYHLMLEPRFHINIILNGASPTGVSSTEASSTITSDTGVSSTRTSSIGVSSLDTRDTDVSSTSTSAIGITSTRTSASQVNSTITSAIGVSSTRTSSIGVSSLDTRDTDVSSTTTSAIGITSTRTSASQVNSTITSAIGVSSTRTSSIGVSSLDTRDTDVSSTTTSAIGITSTRTSASQVNSTIRSDTGVSSTRTSSIGVSSIGTRDVGGPNSTRTIKIGESSTGSSKTNVSANIPSSPITSTTPKSIRNEESQALSAIIGTFAAFIVIFVIILITLKCFQKNHWFSGKTYYMPNDLEVELALCHLYQQRKIAHE